MPRQPPLTKDGWNSISSKLPLGKNVGMFILRDVESLSTSTNGKRLHGFALISKSNVEVDAGKSTLKPATCEMKYRRLIEKLATHARINKRRSKAEVKKLLLDGK